MATFALFLSLYTHVYICIQAYYYLLFSALFDSVRYPNPSALNASAMFFLRTKVFSCSCSKYRLWFYFFVNPVYYLCLISIQEQRKQWGELLIAATHFLSYSPLCIFRKPSVKMKDRGWFSNLNKYKVIDGQGPCSIKSKPYFVRYCIQLNHFRRYLLVFIFIYS